MEFGTVVKFIIFAFFVLLLFWIVFGMLRSV